MTYELLIIGGGPGAVAAGVYAARKKINTALVTETFGGASVVSLDIQNWIGDSHISGLDLAKNFEEHLRAQEGIEIVDGDRVTEVADRGELFEVKTQNGKTFEARFLLVATGSNRRKLNVPGEKEFDGRGVVYCSTCDAPLFAGKKVAIVGGGNAGLEAVVDSLPYAEHITLLEYMDKLKGDAVTQEKLKDNPKLNIVTMAETKEVLGDVFVNALRYADRTTGEVKQLDVEGVFVEIGAVPNSSFVKDLVKLNEMGEIVVDHQTQQSSHSRIWAAGDVTDVIYKQNNISAGDGVKALLNIYETIHKG